MIKPVTGRRSDGSSVEGYAFEVSGSGTAGITGGIANVNFANTLRQALDSTGKGVDVVSVAPRVGAARPTTTTVGASDVGTRLRSLRELLDQGLITASEYETRRREILGQI